MGGEATSGLKTAVEQALALAPATPEPVAHQLPLYPADQLDALPLDGTRQSALLAPRSGPGRPPGRANKRTEEWRDFLLKRYRSPLIGLAETIARPVGVLALELGCTRLEAFQLQQKAMIELAPYCHGKMPVEINVQGKMPVLIMADPAQFLAACAEQGEEADLLDLSAVEIIANQEVSDVIGQPVGQPELDSTAKAQPDQAVSAPEPLIEDQPAAPGGGEK